MKSDNAAAGVISPFARSRFVCLCVFLSTPLFEAHYDYALCQKVPKLEKEAKVDYTT